MSHTFIALDFETVNPSRASICACGIVRVTDGLLMDSYHRYCRPPHPELEFIRPGHLKLTGIKFDDLRGAIPFERLADSLERNIDTVLVTHSEADLQMLEQAWVWAGRGQLFEFEHIDTIKVAHKVWPGLPSYKLSELYKSVFRRPMSGAHHNAADDAKATAEILLRALDQTQTTVDDWARIRMPKNFVPRKVTKRLGMDYPFPASVA